jgi:hypothetical protein
MRYAHIQNDSVVATFDGVPHVFQNISGFDALSPALRESFGFRPVIDGRSALPTPYHQHTNDRLEYDTQTNRVTRKAEATLLALDVIRAQMSARVTEIRDELMNAGVQFQGNVFDSDSRSIQNLTAVTAGIAAGMSIPSLSWRTQNNVTVVLTAGELVSLAATMLVRMQEIYSHSWVLKNEIAESQTPHTINLNEGWPQ